MNRSRIALAALALWFAASTGCSPAIAYFHVSIEPFSTPTGTNCGAQNNLRTFSGFDLSQDWTIFPAPNNQFLLTGTSSGVALTGTLKGGVYTFTGTTDDVLTTTTPAGTDTTTSTVSTSVTLTTQGGGFTGNISQVQGCTTTSGSGCLCDSGTGFACIDVNGQNFNTTSGANFSCSESATIGGTQLSNVQQQHTD